MTSHDSVRSWGIKQGTEWSKDERGAAPPRMQKDSTDPGKIKREGKKGRKKGKEERVWKGGEEEKKEKRLDQKNISVEKVASLRRNLAVNGRTAGIDND